MKILYITDTHVSSRKPICRTDNYLEIGLSKLRYIAKIAKDNSDIKFVIHGGDLFETPDVSNKIAGDVVEIFQSIGKPVVFNIGSHDTYSYNPDSYMYGKLNLFSKHDWFYILENKEFNYKYHDCDINVFGISHGLENETAMFNDKLKLRLPEHDRKKVINIVTIHGMLFNNNVNMKNKLFLKAIHELDFKNVDVVLSSHYHPGYPVYKKHDCWYANPGGMMRNTINDVDRIPQYCIINIKKGVIQCKYYKIPYEKNVFVDRFVGTILPEDLDNDIILPSIDVGKLDVLIKKIGQKKKFHSRSIDICLQKVN